VGALEVLGVRQQYRQKFPAKEEAKQEYQIYTLLVGNEVKPYMRADQKGLYNGTRSCKRLLP